MRICFSASEMFYDVLSVIRISPVQVAIWWSEESDTGYTDMGLTVISGISGGIVKL